MKYMKLNLWVKGNYCSLSSVVYVFKSFDMSVEDSIRDENIRYKSLRIGVLSPEHTDKTPCSGFVLTVLQYLDGRWR